MTAATMRVAVTINSVEDDPVFRELSGFHGVDRVRRACLLMRLGAYALRASHPATASAGANTSLHLVATETSKSGANVPQPSDSAPALGTQEAFDLLDLDISELQRNIRGATK
jgi:hypothetical protein